VYCQTNLSYLEFESSKNVFINNGYKIEFNLEEYNILKDDKIITSNNIKGIKSFKFSESKNYTLISNLGIENSKNIRISNICLYDRYYNVIYEAADSVYNDYFSNLYEINNKGYLATYNINNNIIILRKNDENFFIQLPHYLNYKVECQHYLKMDENFIYVIKNITNTKYDELVPGLTLFYRININSFEIETTEIPLNVITTYMVFNNCLVYSGIQGDLTKTLIYDLNLNTVKEIGKNFNLMVNFNNSFICISNTGISIYDYQFNNQLFSFSKKFNIVDYFFIDKEFYLLEYQLDKLIIYKLDIGNNVDLIECLELPKSVQSYLFKLEETFLINNKTILLKNN